ncbi:MAG: PH domain-containing protein [Halobacteriaceae archaeon]
MKRLEPRVRYEWLVGVVMTALVVGGLGGAALVVGLDRSPVPALVVGGLILLVGVVHVIYRYRVWRFELRDEELYIRRGVLTQVRTLVPYVRVQHVDSRRAPLERAFGLASVVVYTAGSRGADVTIPGLTPERAAELQQRLRTLAIESEPDDAV